jgi:2-acylglycerol O-acyltransferase 2
MFFPKIIETIFMKFRLPLLIFWGRYLTWLPFHNPLSVIFGAPISVVQMEEPTQEQIDELYNEFMKQTKLLFHTYKGKYGYDDDEILVIREAYENDKKND